VYLPLLALSGTVAAQSKPRVLKQRTLPISSGTAVLQTTAPPLHYLPSLDEIKQKSNDPALKKLSQPKEKLPNANRCRPGNKVCQDYWQKQGKPSSNSQLFLPQDSRPTPSLANLLAWNSFGGTSPLDRFKNTSDVPVGFGFFARKAAPVAAPALGQGGVTYGGWQTEMTQGRNRLGRSDLFSGNYHWSVPIVGLPGRAGHDLGLSLSYNSHLWVKTTNGTMRMIDTDAPIGAPGGGFFVGLPYLHGTTHTTRTGLPAYLLVLPSGEAKELIRRGGSANSQVYESMDGAVVRLVVETSANQYLFFPDGTRLRFQNYLCTEMRDRNGNLITATYDSTYGLLTKLTDTLGRDITVHYYDPTGKDFFEPGYAGYFEITDLKHNRKDENGNPVTVTLAHFGYRTCLQFRSCLVITHSSTSFGGKNSVKTPNCVKITPFMHVILEAKLSSGSNCKQVLYCAWSYRNCCEYS
jgi:hypothetical protein